MKLGIMQPYFFPYLGYFDLIKKTDRWIVFDTVQFIRHGWVNRNRILHPKESWQYIIVPTRKHDQKTAIKDIWIANDDRWVEKILGQLQHYKKRAPFYNAVIDIVNDGLSFTGDSLSLLNARCLEKVCAYLEIPLQLSLFSQMNLELGTIEGPGDWALRISEMLGADEYINPPGGAGLFDRSKFEEAGIQLTIQKPVEFAYDCDGYEFQSNLSIIDVMMWNSPESICNYFISRQQEERS